MKSKCSFVPVVTRRSTSLSFGRHFLLYDFLVTRCMTSPPNKTRSIPRQLAKTPSDGKFLYVFLKVNMH